MIIYEWDLETFDEDGDIVDHSFADKLTGHKLSDIDEHTRLVLVRDTCDKVGSVELREWAYAYRYPSSQHRAAELQPWMHHYNFHRPHSATSHTPPASRLGFDGNNVLRHYT